MLSHTMNMNKELNFVRASLTERRTAWEPGCSESGQGLLGRRPETTRHIGARMWYQMSKGSHTFMSR